MTNALRLLSIGHPYVVRLNRRLVHELAREGRGRWDVTAVAPAYFHGGNDLRPIAFESWESGEEPCRVEVVTARLTRRVHVFHYGRRLREVLRQGWDLIHAWEEPYVVVGGQVAALTPRGVPLVFRTAQNLSKRYPPPFNWIERLAMRRAAGWSYCGQTVADALLHRPGYRHRPGRLIPLGVDIGAFRRDPEGGREVRRELGWRDEGPPIIGYLGRFASAKGIGVQMATLEKVHAPWRALFVGAGEMEGELRAWAARHGDRVRVCTAVKHDEVPRYLNAMNVLAAPSLTTPRWREQFGRMLIEAFACGVPVVGSDSGEIPYVIGDAGLVVPEGDVDAWAVALGELLESPARRAELAARGLQRAHSKYAWPVVARQYLDFFEEIMGSGRRGET